MLVVSDTSPVSALVVMGWLDWLQQRWETVSIPPAVWQELEGRSTPRDWERLEDARCSGWLRVCAPRDSGMVMQLEADLDRGEAEAIVLAIEMHAAWLLMDERDGREIAERHGLKLSGTVGMVVWAKQKGLIPSVQAALLLLRSRARFFLGDDLIAFVAREAGETDS